MTDASSVAQHDEIPESTTDSTIAGLYADIRQVSGLPGINLFYRRLAYAGADVLNSFWQQVKPLYASRELNRAGRALEQAVVLPGVCVLDDALLKAAGIARDERASVRATLRYFNQANAMHLVLFSFVAKALLNEDNPGVAAPQAQAEPALNGDAELLSLPAWDDTPAESQILISAIRNRLAPGLADTIRPTLLRHFGPYPVLLAALHGYVGTHDSALIDTVAHTRMQALQLAFASNTDVAFAFDADVHQVIHDTTTEFRQIIPVMLVLGSAMIRGL